MELLSLILIIVLILIISALPLHFAVKLLGGHSTIIKVLFVNLLVGIVLAVLNFLFGYVAGIIGFIAMILIYMNMFDLGFLRALLAWLLQAVIAAIIGILLVVLFGITLTAAILL